MLFFLIILVGFHFQFTTNNSFKRIYYLKMKIEQNNRKNLKQKQKIIEKYYQDLLFSRSWRLTVGENF